jgi:hypothetical protein
MTARAEIRAARAEKFTIQIRGEAAGRPRKLAKIFFGRRDGSVYLDFPYFQRSDGIVAHVRLPAGLQYPRDISLVDGGKITSHLVKYAHHRDGEAHFSQTGRVVTLVRKKATPLNSYSGHLFTIQIQGLDGFDEARGPDSDHQNMKDKPLTFNVFGREPQGVKMVAFWYNNRDLRKRVGGELVGPGVTLIAADGSRHPGLILSAVAGTPGAGSYILLRALRIPPLTSEPGSHLTFIGGFDRNANDLGLDTGFLALSYPAAAADSLRDSIGTIDVLEKS